MIDLLIGFVIGCQVATHGASLCKPNIHLNIDEDVPTEIGNSQVNLR